MTPLSWHSWRRQKDIEAEREIIAMATGRKTTIPNARWKPPEKEGEKGKLEIDPPKKKKTLQQRYAAKKKQKWKSIR